MRKKERKRVAKRHVPNTDRQKTWRRKGTKESIERNMVPTLTERKLCRNMVLMIYGEKG
jgi:hypothetical protein